MPDYRLGSIVILSDLCNRHYRKFNKPTARFVAIIHGPYAFELRLHLQPIGVDIRFIIARLLLTPRLWCRRNTFHYQIFYRLLAQWPKTA